MGVPSELFSRAGSSKMPAQNAENFKFSTQSTENVENFLLEVLNILKIPSQPIEN